MVQRTHFHSQVVSTKCQTQPISRNNPDTADVAHKVNRSVIGNRLYARIGTLFLLQRPARVALRNSLCSMRYKVTASDCQQRVYVIEYGIGAIVAYVNLFCAL